MVTTKFEDKIVPVIMAGGAGTRLWPVSRETMPKQFIPLLDGRLSTFQATLERVNHDGFGSPIVVTGSEFRFVVAEQMSSIGVAGEIVLEPERRDSAAAVAVGAILSLQRQREAICLVLAADHVVSDDAAFRSDCLSTLPAARSGRIVTLGIAPTFPSTGYGYIEPGELLKDTSSRALTRFVEKPNRETAERYIESGLLWNSGNFIFQAETMLQELDEWAPDVVSAAREAVTDSKRDLDFVRLDPAAFARAPKISIDYAVMEKTKRAGVVRASFGWSDVGSWDSIYEFKDKDRNENILEGSVAVIETTGSLVRSDGPLTGVIGLRDVVVVTTSDAVLVTSREYAPKVKELVALLHQNGHPEATEHLRIHRPWGWYQRIDVGDRFQVKHICVKPGGTLSLQRHYHRAEHWVVVKGTAEVTIDDAVKLYHENEAAYLPIGSIHRMRNPGKIDLKIIEVQVGSYTGEDDIVRLEDVYARR